MRALYVVSLLAVFCPAVAMAQSPAAPVTPSPAPEAAPAPSAAPAAASPAPSAAYRRGGDITRNDYIERAKRNAEKRFDRMDADHNGVLTAEERHTYYAAHHKRRAKAPH